MNQFTDKIVMIVGATGEPNLARVIEGSHTNLHIKFTNGAEDSVKFSEATFIDKTEFLQLITDMEVEREAEIASMGAEYNQFRPTRPYSGIAASILDAADSEPEELAGIGELVRVKAAHGRWSGRFGVVIEIALNAILVRLLTSEFQPVGSPVPLQHGDVEIYHIPYPLDEIVVTDSHLSKYREARGHVVHSLPDDPFAIYVCLKEGPHLGSETPIYTTMHRKEFKIVKKKSGE